MNEKSNMVTITLSTEEWGVVTASLKHAESLVQDGQADAIRESIYKQV